MQRLTMTHHKSRPKHVGSGAPYALHHAMRSAPVRSLSNTGAQRRTRVRQSPPPPLPLTAVVPALHQSSDDGAELDDDDDDDNDEEEVATGVVDFAVGVRSRRFVDTTATTSWVTRSTAYWRNLDNSGTPNLRCDVAAEEGNIICRSPSEYARGVSLINEILLICAVAYASGSKSADSHKSSISDTVSGKMLRLTCKNMHADMCGTTSKSAVRARYAQ